MLEIRYKIENNKTYIMAMFKNGDFYKVFNRIMNENDIIKYFKNRNIYYKKYNVVNQWSD